MSELSTKLETIRDLLVDHRLDALVLERAGSFAWATCGASSYINTASTNGLASVLITPTERYILTTNIEAPRIGNEEGLAAQGWQVIATPWYETRNVVAEMAAGLKLGADASMPGATDISGAIARLRSILLPEEQKRIRALGVLCAAAMDAAIRAVKPGMSEYEIAALAAFESERRGVQAVVNLIATDERIFKYRHPLPANKKLEKYAMIVLCGRRQGLICSITRFVHFGKLPDELRRKQDALVKIDAAFNLITRPGTTLGEVFNTATDVYASNGFADEWRLHHQGGPAGYEAREWIVTPSATDAVSVGQLYAWNPSITGIKMEDSMLVGEDSNEIITTIAGWPSLEAVVKGTVIQRPVILEL